MKNIAILYSDANKALGIIKTSREEDFLKLFGCK